MQKVSEIVITVYATIFYVLTSKFGSLVPFSKMISQKLKINLLVVESIIFGFVFYIFFRIGYSILGLKFGHEAFSVGGQDKNSLYGKALHDQKVIRGIADGTIRFGQGIGIMSDSSGTGSSGTGSSPTGSYAVATNAKTCPSGMVMVNGRCQPAARVASNSPPPPSSNNRRQQILAAGRQLLEQQRGGTPQHSAAQLAAAAATQQSTSPGNSMAIAAGRKALAGRSTPQHSAAQLAAAQQSQQSNTPRNSMLNSR